MSPLILLFLGGRVEFFGDLILGSSGDLFLMSELYIYDIAVKTDLHNRGIGKELISYLKEYSIKNEIEAIFVQAYSEEEQAVRFYESTLGDGIKVDHFTFEVKTT